MKQFFFSSFPREDLRKWLSYVCRLRDHSLSHEISLSHQTSSSSPALSLSHCSLLFTHTKTLHWVFLFFSPSCLYQSTHWHKHFFPVVVLFNCLCITRFYFTAMPLAVEKTWLSNHLLQNLQTGLDHRSISSASTVAVVDVLEFCRHRHTLEGCRNCCCCWCRNLPVFFLPRNTRDHHTTGDPRFSFLPAGVTHGFSPLGARARSLELELVVALVSSGRTRFFAEKHRHSL